MLPAVRISPHCCSAGTNFENYRGLVEDQVIDEVMALARRLKGARVCHVNATSAGGGVAELLFRLIPAYRALGLAADWRIIHGDPEFYAATKNLHNSLQGGPLGLSRELQQEYVRHNETGAAAMAGDYDAYVIHDPQPAGLATAKARLSGKWIWRCHIDSSNPNPASWGFLRPFVELYDAAVFTLESFRPADLTVPRVVFIPPAIDPFGTKNMELPHDLCRRVVADAGVRLGSPLVIQVSRFDPWKDPLGVLAAYRALKRYRPDAQLAFIGAMAGDDPEGWQLLDELQEEVRDEPDVHIFTNLTGVGSMEVNAFQRAADVVIQKSIREGFGLVVSEALWKGKPVVAGRAGGIPLQFPSGYERFLVDGSDDCARQTAFLLDNPDVSAEFGRAGRDRVRREFLMPRLVRDELRLIAEVLGR